MRLLRGCALLLLPILLCLTVTSCSAQILYPLFGYPRPFQPPPDPRDAPVEVGGYVALGSSIEDTPPPRSGVFIGSAGLYAQWNRYGLCPGVDLRVQGNQNDLHGYLVGPRVAFQPRGRMRPLRLYAEGLFGKNEIAYGPQTLPSSTAAARDQVGVTRTVVIGLDLHAASDAPFAWRVIEFSKGTFSGLPDSHPQTLTTGIIFHIP